MPKVPPTRTTVARATPAKTVVLPKGITPAETAPKAVHPAAHLSFLGRQHLLDQCRQAVDAGQPLWLSGEFGVGKTALAKRINHEAIYLPNVTPIKEMLGSLLLECYRRGWYPPQRMKEEGGRMKGHKGEDADRESDNDGRNIEQIERAIARLDYRTSAKLAADALAGKNAVVILDDFETATPTTLRVARGLAEVATLIVCSAHARPSQLPFLFGFQRVDIPRLTKAETTKLALRLLSEHPLSRFEHARLLRHLVEESQGLPSVLHELVRRALAKGDLSLGTVRQETITGHKQIDMTPLLVVVLALAVGLRVAVRGLGDNDLTILMGLLGVLFLLVRFYAGRLSGRR